MTVGHVCSIESDVRWPSNNNTDDDDGSSVVVQVLGRDGEL